MDLGQLGDCAASLIELVVFPGSLEDVARLSDILALPVELAVSKVANVHIAISPYHPSIPVPLEIHALIHCLLVRRYFNPHPAFLIALAVALCHLAIVGTSILVLDHFDLQSGIDLPQFSQMRSQVKWLLSLA